MKGYVKKDLNQKRFAENSKLLDFNIVLWFGNNKERKN